MTSILLSVHCCLLFTLDLLSHKAVGLHKHWSLWTLVTRCPIFHIKLLPIYSESFTSLDSPFDFVTTSAIAPTTRQHAPFHLFNPYAPPSPPSSPPSFSHPPSAPLTSPCTLSSPLIHPPQSPSRHLTWETNCCMVWGGGGRRRQ